jgi:hypothetical protein
MANSNIRRTERKPALAGFIGLSQTSVLWDLLEAQALRRG